MMWLISIIQFWFKIIFKNKNTSDHKNHMLIVQSCLESGLYESELEWLKLLFPSWSTSLSRCAYFYYKTII